MPVCGVGVLVMTVMMCWCSYACSGGDGTGDKLVRLCLSAM